MNLFAARTATVAPGTMQMCVIMNMRTLGMKAPRILAEHRPLVEKLREQPVTKDMCQATLDVMDGRTYVA